MPTRLAQFVLPLLVLTLLFPAGCDRPPVSAKSPEANPPAPKKVRTLRAAAAPQERLVIATGSLAALQRATLSAKVSGRLLRISVDLGDRIKAGQVIAEIDPHDYQLRVRQAEALLGQARVRLGLPFRGPDEEVVAEETSTVKQAKAVLEESKANRDRISKLAAQNIISLSELETADAAHKVALSRYDDAIDQVRNLQALVLQRRAELEIAQQELADTAIRAPFDGAIQERFANAGEFLNPAAPVASLVRMDPLRLRVEIPEREASKIRLGQTVRIFVEGSDSPVQGELKRLSPAIDERSLMLQAESDIPNPGFLRPGSYVRAEIVVDDNIPRIVVPEEALVTFAGLEKIFIIENGKALEKRVSTGRKTHGGIEILTGLKEADQVILSPGSMKTGDPVLAEDLPLRAAKEGSSS